MLSVSHPVRVIFLFDVRYFDQVVGNMIRRCSVEKRFLGQTLVHQRAAIHNREVILLARLWSVIYLQPHRVVTSRMAADIRLASTWQTRKFHFYDPLSSNWKIMFHLGMMPTRNFLWNKGNRGNMVCEYTSHRCNTASRFILNKHSYGSRPLLFKYWKIYQIKP